VADQGEAHARDNTRTELGRAYPRLPDDLLNFQYDPLACSVALGWPGVRIEELDVAIGIDEDGLLQMRLDPSRGRRMRVVTGVDGPAFDDAWLDAVVRVSRGNTAR
jgi:hypothetical protein